MVLFAWELSKGRGSPSCITIIKSQKCCQIAALFRIGNQEQTAPIVQLLPSFSSPVCSSSGPEPRTTLLLRCLLIRPGQAGSYSSRSRISGTQVPLRTLGLERVAAASRRSQRAPLEIAAGVLDRDDDGPWTTWFPLPIECGDGIVDDFKLIMQSTQHSDFQAMRGIPADSSAWGPDVRPNSTDFLSRRVVIATFYKRASTQQAELNALKILANRFPDLPKPLCHGQVLSGRFGYYIIKEPIPQSLISLALIKEIDNVRSEASTEARESDEELFKLGRWAALNYLLVSHDMV